MVSQFQPARLLTPVLVFFVLAGVSYWINPVPWQHMSARTEATLALSGLFIAALIVVLRRKLYLRIDERGLEVQLAAGAPRIYAWKDIEAVKIVRLRFLLMPLTSSIHLRLRPGLRSGSVVRKAAGAVTGSDASFPAFFEESAEEIVEKIEFFRRESANAAKSRFPA